MNGSDREILEADINKYGLDTQLCILQKECGELIAAISHWRRGHDNALDNLLGELVDVQIMSEELFLYFAKYGCGSILNIKYRHKIDRLAERLKQNPLSEDSGGLSD